MKKLKIMFLICGILLMSGCSYLPGRGPFGEKIFSESDAAKIYKMVKETISQADYDDWNGYSIDIQGAYDDKAGLLSCTFAKTEEYNAIEYTGDPDRFLWYLWYKDSLYGEKYTEDSKYLEYCDITWEQFGVDQVALQQWQFIKNLLEQEYTELTYKDIPLGSTYMLKVEYEGLEFLEERSLRSATIRVYLDYDGHLDSISLSADERAEDSGFGRIYGSSFFPYENSTSLDMESSLWSFGKAWGLTEEEKPALKEREKDREKARGVIESMDFETLKDKAVYREDLEAPIVELLEFFESM